MTYLNLKKRIAENLGMLSSDDSTIISGTVSSTGIANKINDVYREILFPLLSDKYPADFEQVTYPLSTYTATGTVSATSTGTTLVATTSIFTNSMEGFQVYNSTDDEYATISTYSSETQVTIDTTIGDTWDGDTIYILGNEYSFGGDATDLKEIITVAIKYKSTDTEWTIADRIEKKDGYYYPDSFGEADPQFYLTTIDINGVPTQGVGLLPYPTDYDGKLQIMYVEKPPILSADNDEPSLSIPGLSEVIINGVTAWGKRLQGKFDEAREFEEINRRTGAVYPKGTAGIISSYKPKQRSGCSRLQLADHYLYIRRRSQ
jgi:hypothetical protein